MFNEYRAAVHGLGAIVIQSDFSRGNVSSPQSLETMHLQTLFRNTNVLPREALWEGDLLIDFCHQRGSVEGFKLKGLLSVVLAKQTR